MREPENHCARNEVVSADMLTPSPRNPNEHPEEQLVLMQAILIRFGWRRPVTVSNRSGFIVRGHCRVAVANAMHWSVPVDYQDYDSEEEELADLAADNILAELSYMHAHEVRALISEFNLETPESVGLSPEDYEKLLDGANASSFVTVECGTKSEAEILATKLKADGFDAIANTLIKS